MLRAPSRERTPRPLLPPRPPATPTSRPPPPLSSLRCRRSTGCSKQHPVALRTVYPVPPVPISSSYRLDRNWIETRTSLRDIPNGPDVFEQYFEIKVQEINGVLR